ncbi:MAG: transposase, partial [Opitutales bacterium]
TKYQQASIKVLEKQLAAGGEEAEAIRRRLRVRMGDISEFMKALKQRFSIWFNKSHDRFGTLWADRFKSVLVEGTGHPLQTMAAYIDLNPVRAGLVEDPKDYRFCGYAEAVAGHEAACEGLRRIWADHSGKGSKDELLRSHRSLIFGKGGDPWEMKGRVMTRKQVVRALEEQDGVLPMAAALRCRVRYFTDGAVLGSAEYVRGFLDVAQRMRQRKYPLKANTLKGAPWDGMAVLQSLRREVFS